MNATDLERTQHKSLCAILQKNNDVFSKHDDDLGCFESSDGGPSEVTFGVRDPKIFVYSVPRRVPYERRAWLEEKLKQMEKNGIIEEIHFSNSQVQTSPIVIVPK